MPIPVDPTVTKDTKNKTNKDKSLLLDLFLIVLIAFLFILLLPSALFVFLLITCTIIVLTPIWLPFAVSFAGFFILSRTVGSLPETPQTLLKYERIPGQVEMFLACMSNNFIWPPSMPEHMRRYCFNQITDSESKIDVQSGYNIIFFYQALESGEFLGHENEWVTVYNQEIVAYGKKYSDDELNHIFKKMPGAIQFPVNQKSLPCSKKRKIVTTNRVNGGGDYKVRAGVRRPETPGLVAIMNYDLYDRYNNNKRYECVMDTGAPSTIFPYHIKRTLRGNEGWNINPITSSGYGGGSNEILATRMFEVRLGNNHNWTKWVKAKISVWEQDPGDDVEHALIGNDVTDQLAYAHEPRRPIKFLDSIDEQRLTQFLSQCN